MHELPDNVLDAIQEVVNVCRRIQREGGDSVLRLENAKAEEVALCVLNYLDNEQMRQTLSGLIHMVGGMAEEVNLYWVNLPPNIKDAVGRPVYAEKVCSSLGLKDVWESQVRD